MMRDELITPSAQYVGPDAEEVSTMLQLLGARLIGSRHVYGDTIVVYIPGYKIEIAQCPIGIEQWTALIQRMMVPERKA